MGHRCCGKQKVKRGLWSPEEDEKLVRYIITHGHASWSAVPKLAGLQRCGKSCRLRWINYLRPDLKRGSFTSEEEQIIIDVHRILGNKWAQIAKHLPGRTDNEVKNFWNSCIKKKLISQGLDPTTHNLMPSHKRSASSISVKDINAPTREPQEQTFSVINSQPPSRADDHSISMITCYYQPTNHFDKVNNDPSIFSHGQSVVMSDAPPCASTSSYNTATLGALDENHHDYTNMMNQIAADEPCFQALTSMPTEEQAVKEMVVDGLGRDDDVSFDISNFDIDFAALFSSAMSTDFNPMDEFAWTL